MALIDLLKIAKRVKTGGKFSLKESVDRYLYEEQLALQKGKITDEEIKITEARIELKLAKRKLRSWKTRTDHDRAKYYHPSSVADCARKTFYKFLRAPEDTVSMGSMADCGRTQRIFHCGNYFHLRMQVLFVRMGLCGLDDIEVPFQRGDEQGTCDAVVTINKERVAVDFKSANSYSFKAINQLSPEIKYETQLRMYMKHFKCTRGVLLYENKDDQSIREVIIDYSKKKEMRMINERLDYLREHINNKTPPTKEGTGLTKVPCRYCPYQTICFTKGETKKWLEKKNRKA